MPRDKPSSWLLYVFLSNACQALSLLVLLLLLLLSLLLLFLLFACGGFCYASSWSWSSCLLSFAPFLLCVSACAVLLTMLKLQSY